MMGAWRAKVRGLAVYPPAQEPAVGARSAHFSEHSGLGQAWQERLHPLHEGVRHLLLLPLILWRAQGLRTQQLVNAPHALAPKGSMAHTLGRSGSAHTAAGQCTACTSPEGHHGSYPGALRVCPHSGWSMQRMC